MYAMFQAVCGLSWAVELPVSPPLTGSDTNAALDALHKKLAPVKADYLYRFLNYVEFPKSAFPQADSPLVIGVAGDDDVFHALGEVLQSKSLSQRLVVRRRVSEGDSLTGVQLLYAGRKVDWTQSLLVKSAQLAPILLVGDSQDALASGAVFSFLVSGDQIKFEASLDASERASLRVSARLLSLAERVVGGRR